MEWHQYTTAIPTVVSAGDITIITVVGWVSAWVSKRWEQPLIKTGLACFGGIALAVIASVIALRQVSPPAYSQLKVSLLAEDHRALGKLPLVPKSSPSAEQEKIEVPANSTEQHVSKPVLADDPPPVPTPAPPAVSPHELLPRAVVVGQQSAKKGELVRLSAASSVNAKSFTWRMMITPPGFKMANINYNEHAPTIEFSSDVSGYFQFAMAVEGKYGGADTTVWEVGYGMEEENPQLSMQQVPVQPQVRRVNPNAQGLVDVPPVPRRSNPVLLPPQAAPNERDALTAFIQEIRAVRSNNKDVERVQLARAFERIAQTIKDKSCTSQTDFRENLGAECKRNLGDEAWTRWGSFIHEVGQQWENGIATKTIVPMDGLAVFCEGIAQVLRNSQ